MADVIVGIKARDETRKGIQSVERGFRRLSTGAGKVFKVIGAGALGLAAGIGALGLGVAALTTNYAANVKEARNISKTTGANIKQVSRLTQIFKRFNLEGEDVRDVLNEINIKLVDAQDEGSAVAQAFDLLGLSAAELQAVGSHEALLRISDALNGVEDAATRAWIADSIFGGDMAQKTLPILAMGRKGITELGDEYERLGTVVDAEADKQARRYEAAQQRISAALQGIGNTIGQSVLPYLADLAEQMAPIAQDFAVKFGELVKEVPRLIGENLPIAQQMLADFVDGDWQGAWTRAQTIYESFLLAMPDPWFRTLGDLYLNTLTFLNRFAGGFNSSLRTIEGFVKLFFGAVAVNFQAVANLVIDANNIVEAGMARLQNRPANFLDRISLIGPEKLIDFTPSIPQFQPLQPGQDFWNRYGGITDTAESFMRGLFSLQRQQNRFLADTSILNRLAERMGRTILSDEADRLIGTFAADNARRFDENFNRATFVTEREIRGSDIPQRNYYFDISVAGSILSEEDLATAINRAVEQGMILRD